jgi:MbtH protein
MNGWEDSMTDATTPGRRYLVVVNHEEQYSVWPATSRPPAGWTATGFAGTREDCLAHIETVWPDIRPRSVRERMATREGDS